VQIACLIAIENAYRNPGGFASSSLGGFSVDDPVASEEAAGAPGMSLPPDSRALLGPHRRTPRIGGT
jgi:hypothetical protein